MEEIKKETTKQKQLNKKKMLFILLALVIAAIAIGGIITAFMLNYNVSAPSNLRVIDDGKNVYLAVDMNDNYLKYRFVFTSGDKEIVIESEKNILSIEELEEQNIEIGQTYNITASYIGENKGSNSEESKPITWTAYKYLKATDLIYNIDDNMISWTAVEHADYYIVYISGLDPIQVEETSMELLNIPSGERIFYVACVSNDENYRNSLASNEISVKVIHQYLSFDSVSFDEEDKTITITGKERLDTILVYIDNQSYECVDFEISEKDGIYTYIIDISLLYHGNEKVGVCPASKDEYNVYYGGIIFV